MLGERFLYDGKASVLLSYAQMNAKQAFEEECAKKDSCYKFENYICECGAEEANFDVLAEKDRYGLKVRTVICRKCGLVMTNPRLTQESYNIFYEKSFGDLYRGYGTESTIEERYEEKTADGQNICRYVCSNWKYSIGSVLEIGCAAGGILNGFRLQGYEDVTGVDLDDTYLDYGRSQGMRLIKAHSSELLKEEKKYDLIILSHVFEHFLDIEEELDVVAQLLAENGRVYIEVPGINSLMKGAYSYNIMWYLQNAHVRAFCLGTLVGVMGKYGFELCSGDEYIRSLFQYTGNKKEITNNYFTDIMRTFFVVETAWLNAQKK